MRRFLPVALPFVVVATLHGQSRRTLDVSRQLHDSGDFAVRVTYGAGRFSLRPLSGPLLYQMHLVYDATRGEAIHSYTDATRSVRLGLRYEGGALSHPNREGELRVDLTRSVPMDLDLELGAVEADLDLSGLRLQSLSLKSGASDATVRFDTLNPVQMRRLDLQVGAASLKATGLANANTEEMRVQAGVGEVDLDFGGTWTRDVELSVELALGGVSLRVPHDVGIRVQMERFLTSFEHEGMVKRGGAWYSENWDTAKYHLRVRSQTSFGKFQIDRTE